MGSETLAMIRVMVLGACTAHCAMARAEARHIPAPLWTDTVSAQLALDIHPGLGGVLGFAYAFQPKVLVGVEAGFAWRELGPHFDRHILGAIHGDVFARYLFSDYVHADFELTYLLRFVNRDDVDCPNDYDEHACGRFLGGFATVGVGYRFIFLAARLRAGRASYDDGHAKLGVMMSLPLLRLVANF